MEESPSPLNVQEQEKPEIPEISFVKPPKKKIVKLVKKVVKVATQEVESPEDLEENEKSIELPKETKPKKPRTQAQIDSFKKAQEVRKENSIKRKAEMELIATKQQQELEKKILKKALSIKKREIRNKIALESIPDDDEPVESVLAKVKAIQSKTPKPVVPPPLQYTFV